ncbi:MAG: hydroxymethylglutaryl-CoA lyase [bacterium]|nr:MAG: hydroxymethylglutaryl-CoA lyase [bacterium]
MAAGPGARAGGARKLLLEDEALRDGLQMESRIFTLEEKLELFHLLARSGLRRIQVGSFVHPGIVPQMADTDELVRAIGEVEGVVLTALVLNEKGLERALACGVRHLSMSVSASDTHSRKNAGMPAEEALETMTGLIARAVSEGVQVRAGFQCSFGCVYEGTIEPDAVIRGTKRLAEAGAAEVNLADTAGMATPYSVRDLVSRAARELEGVLISLHLHDTAGLGLANMFAGYEAGVRIFDVATGGLGGCPFVKGAAGNIPAEDAVNMFQSMGVDTGVDIDVLCDAVLFLEARLGRALPGRMRRVLKGAKRD